MVGFTERALPTDTTLNGVAVYFGDKRIGTVWHSNIWGWQWAHWLSEGWMGGQCISKDEGFGKVMDAFESLQASALPNPEATAAHAARVLERMKQTPHGPKRSRLAEQHAKLSNRVHYERGFLAAAEKRRCDNEIIAAAGRIMDVFCGGDTSWRERIDDSLILESADWARAVELATAAFAPFTIE